LAEIVNEEERRRACTPLMCRATGGPLAQQRVNGDLPLSIDVQSQIPMCPKCRRLASLRLRARLPEADGFPEVQCLECRACGDVVVVELGMGEGTEATVVRFAA
jgi:hypothetical protein